MKRIYLVVPAYAKFPVMAGSLDLQDKEKYVYLETSAETIEEGLEIVVDFLKSRNFGYRGVHHWTGMARFRGVDTDLSCKVLQVDCNGEPLA